MTIIHFGDSISSGTPTTIANYSESTGAQMQLLTSRRVIDLSHAGMRLCRAVDPNSGYVKLVSCGLMDSINVLGRLPMGSDVDVIIQLGCNDINNGTPLLTIKTQAKAVVDSILALGSNPVLISPIGRYLEDVNAASTYNDVRSAYASIATSHGCTHINGRTLIDPNDGTLYALPDDEHLSALGHAVMALNIMANL